MSLIQISDVCKEYPLFGGILKRKVNSLTAVSNVSLSIQSGEAVGLVGESGCGKSTLGKLILRLEDPTAGQIIFDGADITSDSPRELRKRRKDFQMIFQDPFSSLNPKMSVYQLLSEPIKNFYPELSKNEILARVKTLMKDVGLKEDFSGRYPHEFSGGQRQRISIGRALASNPKLIVCDEPVSALDVSIQAQILNLLMDLQNKYQFSYLFISHDLHVVRHISQRIYVMYLGHIVESGTRDVLFSNPHHPYTKALLSSVPTIGVKKVKSIRLKGDVPSPIDLPSGCPFHPRCPMAFDRCKHEKPIEKEITAAHFSACHLNIEGEK